VRVVTPNIPEAEVLSGLRIGSPEDARRAALRIRELGAEAIIITGGHAAGHDVVDVLLDGDVFTEFRTPRIANVEVRGTGCTFAAAVAAGLALGLSLPEAAERAQHYVAGAMAHAHVVGRGARVLDHFWESRILKP
jgi:hydroxymethylpyrimidine/phosphomethylpyrimidine kinase